MPNPAHTFEVDLELVGVAEDDHSSVVASVGLLREVESARMRGSMLVCNIDVANLSPSKRDKVVKKICNKVVAIAEHKAANPGRGVFRRKERHHSYVNDLRRRS